jgi:hypothetical protein
MVKVNLILKLFIKFMNNLIANIIKNLNIDLKFSNKKLKSSDNIIVLKNLIEKVLINFQI